MRSIVVVGTQWGDEGKGKIVDLLSEKADIIIRFGGGNNAGHTLVVDGKKLILHLIPSGVIHPGKTLVLGHHMVLDPLALNDEIHTLQAIGLLQDAKKYLRISNLAHIIMPYHIDLDKLREAQKTGKIGTTGRGIGPAYEFKAARCGIRMGHLRYPELFRGLAEKALAKANPEIERLGGERHSVSSVVGLLCLASHNLAPYIDNIHPIIQDTKALNLKILFEAAQGAELDMDQGTYPFVTSSTTLASAAASGSGLGPMDIQKVIGVVKTYTTRVGGGPFPTELLYEVGKHIRTVGAEYGSTTGRDRRCGWLDLVQLRHAVGANGIKELFWTKLDVLRGLHPLRICVSYRFRGETITSWNDIPAELLHEAEPNYISLDGFDEDISGARDISDLSLKALAIPRYVCEKLGVTISGISVGPDREQTIMVNKFPWGYPGISTFTF